MENAMIKKSLLILGLFISIFNNVIFANNWSSYTVREAINSSQSANVFEALANEMQLNNWEYDGSHWDYQYIPEEIEELREKAMDREKDIDFTISSELSHDDKQYLKDLHSYYENIEFTNYFRNYKKIVLIIVGIFITMIIFIFVFRKWFIMLIGLSIIIALSFTFLPNVIQKNNRQSDIFNYLLNKATNNISTMTLQENDLNSINKYNTEHNVSKIINDYLIKTYLCVRSKVNIEDLDNFEWYKYNHFTVFRSDNGSTIRNGNFVNNIFDYSLQNYTDGEAMSKEDMKCIYDNITEEDINDFNNGVFLEKFIKRISQDIKFKDWEELCDVRCKDLLVEIVQPNYFEAEGCLDRDILCSLKYWYIDGKNSRDINLPYGIVLHYDKTSYIKNDIKEFDYSNAYFLNENIREQKNNIVYNLTKSYPFVESKDYNNKQDLFIYYYDSNDKRQGLCTDIEFVDEGIFKKNQMYFHPLDILYDVKPATVSMEYVGNK